MSYQDAYQGPNRAGQPEPPESAYRVAATRWFKAKESLDEAAQRQREANERMEVATQEERNAWDEMEATAGRAGPTAPMISPRAR